MPILNNGRYFSDLWCNGSTRVFDTLRYGSNPYRSIMLISFTIYETIGITPYNFANEETFRAYWRLPMTDLDLVEGKEYAVRYSFYENQESQGIFHWSFGIEPITDKEFFGFDTGECYIPLDKVLEIREIPNYDDLKVIYKK